MEAFEVAAADVAPAVVRLAAEVVVPDAWLDRLDPGVHRVEVAGEHRTVVLFDPAGDGSELTAALDGPDAVSLDDTYFAVRAPQGVVSLAPAGLVLTVTGYGGLYGDPRIAPTTSCYECSGTVVHHYVPEDVSFDGNGRSYCVEDRTELVLHDPCSADL